jgi:predicted RNA-binding protein with EMAP domain
MKMTTMTHKGYGRIYVDKLENVQAVKQIIKELDDFEYSYLPIDYIAPFYEYPNVIYTGKFSDLNIDQLTAICWKRGIYIWAFDSEYDEFPQNLCD